MKRSILFRSGRPGGSWTRVQNSAKTDEQNKVRESPQKKKTEKEIERERDPDELRASEAAVDEE